MMHECILWTGTKMKAGYGRVFPIGGGGELAHRVIYEMFYGVELPRKMVIHHLCETKDCVNPYHLTAMTQYEHVQYHLRPRARICDKCGREKTGRYRTTCSPRVQFKCKWCDMMLKRRLRAEKKASGQEERAA